MLCSVRGRVEDKMGTGIDARRGESGLEGETEGGLEKTECGL